MIDNIISKRLVEENATQSFMYYVSDGVYGSFNCILYDHVTPTPALLEVGMCVEWGEERRRGGIEERGEEEAEEVGHKKSNLGAGQ